MLLKTRSFYLLMSILIIMQLWCALVSIRYPYMGIYVEAQNQNWSVTNLSKDGIGKQQLQIGDIIVSIDHTNPDDYFSIAKWKNIEQAKQIQILRNNESLTLHFSGRSLVMYDIMPYLEGVVCFLLAAVIWKNMKYSLSARMLAVVFWSGSIIYMSQGASIRGDGIGKMLIGTFIMALPVFFHQFLITFFKEKGNIILSSTVLKIQYIFVVTELLLKIPYLYQSDWTYPIYWIDAKVSILFFIAGFIYDLALLGYIYTRHGRGQSYLASIIKSIWYSLFISFLPVISLSFIPTFFTAEGIVNAVYTSWYLLFFPASFAYLIASDQLYDIGLVFRRFLFGCILALVPASLFTGIYTALFHRSVGKEQILFIFFGSLVMLAIMLYSTEYLITRMETVFFPRKSMLKTSLKKISKNLSTISTMRELKEIFLADIVQTLEVQGGAIVCQYPGSVEIMETGEVNTQEVESLLAQNTLAASTQYTCLEISRTEESTNYLVMTRKRTNVLLSREEQQWLGLITSYLEVSLENVHLIRTLTNKLQDLSSRFSDETSAVEFQWFRKVMFELQEEERIRIASDLHDTTMQDLFFLKRRFAALMEKYVMNQEDQEHLDNILKFVDLINASLRQSCFELNPHLLREIGLIPTLRQYLEKEAYTAPFHIHFDPGSDSGRIEQEPLATKRHLLRIVQELLNNAKKHSEATKVTFRLSSTPHEFRLIYEDDGVGMKSTEAELREIGGSGIGLEQMKGRVLLLQGSMEQTNKPDSGVIISISIPMREVPDYGLNRKSSGR